VEAAGRCLICSRPVCHACLQNERGKILCPEHRGAAETPGECVAGTIPYEIDDCADFGTRAVAYVIDGLLLTIAVSLIYRIYITFDSIEQSFLSNFIGMNLVFVVFFGVYCTILVGWRGQTMGHAAVGIKVLGENGGPVSYWQAFIRWVGYFICTLSFFIGFLALARDPRRQGWHDKIARTVVVGESLTLKEKTVAGLALVVFGLPVLVLVFLQVFAPW
jgi:uncharacterized RDD family membrane protein YckC